jgi:hypothetical protein
VVAVSYAALAVRAGTPWPWSSVVHEDGQRTLLDTVFYFAHALRELPLDIVLGLAVAGAVRAFVPAGEGARGRVPATVGAVVVGLFIAGGTIWTVGPADALRNLAQMHTRPGAELEWGAHWRYHLFSRLALMAAAFFLAGLAASSRIGRPAPLRDTRSFHRALAAFALLSLIFLPDLAPLVDAVHLGHQARELATHALVTLPLALGAALLARGDSDRSGDPSDAGSGRSSRNALIAAAAVAGVLGAWLAVGAVTTGASSKGQTNDLVVLLCAHVFEHSLGYLLVPLVAFAACASPLRPSGERTISSSSISEGS